MLHDANIPARRALVVFAALAVLMVIVAYLLTVLLAILCVVFPLLLIMETVNLQTILLFVAGAVISASLLWSLVPRPDTFIAPGILLDRSTHPRLFVEIDNIGAALQQRLPAEVYLIGEPNAWVADVGTREGKAGEYWVWDSL